MTKEIVSLKVKIEDGKDRKVFVIVRKAVFDNSGKIVYKSGLSYNGKWIEVMEGQKYPHECIHEVKDILIEYPEVDKELFW